MPARVCPTCRLRNEEARATCLRCGDALDVVVRAGPPTAGPGVWREGDLLVVEKGQTLPDRCVRCGRPAAMRLAQRYYWHSPALYILAFVALLLYAIVAGLVRQSASLDVGLCAQHFTERRRKIAFAWILGLVGFFGLLGAIGGDLGAVVIIGALLMFLAGLLVGVRGSALLRAKHIDDRFARLKGASPNFLQSLPGVSGLR